MGDQPTKRNDFNLLHLSIIFAVLAIISAVVFPPSFNDSMYGRENARRATCLNNLKQLGLALALYAGDNHGWYPVDSDSPTLAGSMRLLSNNLGVAKILTCPSDWRVTRGEFATLATNNISYSYVPFLKNDGNSNAIVMLDRIYSTKHGSKWPAMGNHRDYGGNILFGDGHVSFKGELPADLPSVLSP
jgi:prepilin-type processing-associated H-X9-DG protein